MADLISKQALKEDLLKRGFYPVIVKCALEAAPIVDAVEVVRCYKCKQSERMESPYGTVVHCHFWNKTVAYDGFCHEGY